MTLGHVSGEVEAKTLLPFLSHDDPTVRGAAALALARHQPEVALRALPTQLRLEMEAAFKLNDDYVRRGKPHLTRAEIDTITGSFRCQVKMVQAISMLKGVSAMQALEEQAFRSGEDFSQMNSVVAAFQLWDRIGVNARSAVQVLGSGDVLVADRAEWMRVQGGPTVLPDVRKALIDRDPAVRARAIRIVAWLGDTESLETLQVMQKTEPTDATLVTWAIEKIQSLHPKL